MILSEIRDYLRQHRRANMSDLAARFDTEPDALRGMLETLERKGRVKRPDADAQCSGCMKCDAALTEIFEWRG